MLKLLKRFLKMKFKDSFEYKINWLFVFFFAITIVVFSPMFWYLLTGGGEINGWSFPELSLLSFVSVAANCLVIFLGFEAIDDKLKNQITVYMTKPANVLFQFLGHGIWYLQFFELAIYLITIFAYVLIFDLTVNLLLFIPFFIFSFLIQVCFLFLPIIVGLYWYDAHRDVNGIIWNLFHFTRDPIDRIKTGNIFISIILFPLLFIAVYPVRAFTDNLEVSLQMFAGIIAFILIILSIEYWLWKRGLKQYESFGG